MERGAVASQEVIKELGTNGGGYFNANSAHPFENPTPFTNLFEIFLILLIPVALTRTFGIMTGSVRQGYAILGTMAAIWAGFVALMMWTEFAHHGPALQAAGGAMEGKELRFGIGGSSLFAVTTTLTSTGAVDSFHSSYTGLGGGITMLGMMLGEIAPGGVGSGPTACWSWRSSRCSSRGSWSAAPRSTWARRSAPARSSSPPATS